MLDQKIIPTEKNKASDVFRLFLTYLKKKFFIPKRQVSITLVRMFIKTKGFTLYRPLLACTHIFVIFIGRTDAEAETPILWLPDGKN